MIDQVPWLASTAVRLSERETMAEHSKIEWTDATWNPVRGCVKVSPGCKHCYAEAFAERFRGVPDHPYTQGFDVRLVPGKLIEPLLWARPRTVFVNSMSDLFQEDVSDEYVALVARVMLLAPWHTYQVLTKRPDRMRDMLNGPLAAAARARHIWWGVSVEDRKYGVPRISSLRSANAAMRFLSIEPLLEEIGDVNLNNLDWVIVGGESGPGARPMQATWVRSLKAQCEKSDVPFFFKQWGGVRKSRTGRLLDGRTFDAMPERSVAPVAAAPERKLRAERVMRDAGAARLSDFVIEPGSRGDVLPARPAHVRVRVAHRRSDREAQDVRQQDRAVLFPPEQLARSCAGRAEGSRRGAALVGPGRLVVAAHHESTGSPRRIRGPAQARAWLRFGKALADS